MPLAAKDFLLSWLIRTLKSLAWHHLSGRNYFLVKHNCNSYSIHEGYGAMGTISGFLGIDSVFRVHPVIIQLVKANCVN